MTGLLYFSKILTMLTIRLQRVGRKNDPSFRLIVTDSRRGSRSGKYLETLGFYDPRKKRIDLKAERVKHWLANGSKTSRTAYDILAKNGLLTKKIRGV